MNIIRCCAVLALLVGCDLVSEVVPAERMARIISYGGEEIQITAPDTVRRGTRFNVSVRTYFCHGYLPSATTVEMRGMTATIIPYIQPETNDHPTDCTIFVDSALQMAWVRFTEPGTASVVVVGLGAGDTLRVERTIHVR